MGLISRVSSRTYSSDMISRSLAFQLSKRFGSDGPRKFQVYSAKSHDYFNYRNVRNTIIYFAAGTWAFLEGARMIMGDAVYCDYDPEKYTPQRWEQRQNAVTRWIDKNMCCDPKIGKKVELANAVRWANREQIGITIR